MCQIDIIGPESVNGPGIAERFGKVLSRNICIRPMVPEWFGKGTSFDGNEEAIIVHYRSIFSDPAMMMANVNHAKSIDALPVQPISIEDWVRMHGGALNRLIQGCPASLIQSTAKSQSMHPLEHSHPVQHFGMEATTIPAFGKATA